MRDTILIVDDQSINRLMLAEILKNDYKILEAVDGVQALDMLSKHSNELAAMLLDIVMPKMSGPDVLIEMEKKKMMEEFPVMVCSGEGSLDVVEKCFGYGIADFIRKPYESEMVLQRVKKFDSLYRARNESNAKLRKFASVLQNQNKILEMQAKKQKKDNTNIIDSLGTIVEYRNTENHDHVKRVKAFTKVLAQHIMNEFPEYKLNDKKIEMITTASALHDIGKIMIPDNILFKPGKYTNEEFSYMKSHTIRGYDIITQIADNWDKELMEYSRQIARSHHEKFDGRGYPENLKGDDIPIAAQIVSVTDCFEALISESLYKKAYSFDVAFHMILNGDCGVFNPKLTEAFRNSRDEFRDIAESSSDGSPDDVIEEANVDLDL
ncbi:MAG: response regulator [Lachnospiraceae bacterium]|nr:response regulator [Lachnospiraceae bacterium]